MTLPFNPLIEFPYVVNKEDNGQQQDLQDSLRAIFQQYTTAINQALTAGAGDTDTFADISGTLADAQLVSTNVTQFEADLAIAWGQLTGQPTTLGGYGITDAVSNQGGSTIQASGAGVTALILKQAATPTADVFQIQDSTGDILLRVFERGHLKIGQGTTADTNMTPCIYVELAGTDTSHEQLFRLDNTFISTSNFQFRGFGIELGTGNNVSVGQVALVGYGTNGSRVSLLRFSQSNTVGTILPDQPISFTNNKEFFQSTATPGGNVVNMVKFDSSNNLLVGPRCGTSLDQSLRLIINVSGTPASNFLWQTTPTGAAFTEIMRLTAAGKLGLNGVTSPSQIIDIGSGKIVADGSLLTNLPPNAMVAAPASSTSSGTAGQWAKDASNVYICVATNTWYKFTATAPSF